MSTTWAPFWLDTWTPAPLDVERVDSSSNSGTDVQTIDVNVPTGTAIGDTVLAWFNMRSNTDPVTPSGWTKLGQWESDSGSAGAQLALYKRDITTTPPAQWTFDAGASNRWNVILTTYRNVIDIQLGDPNFGSPGDTATALSMTPGGDGMLLMGVTSRDNSNSTPSGMTLFQSDEGSASEGYVWDQVISSNPTGDKSTTFPGTTQWVAIQVALLDAVVVVTDPQYIAPHSAAGGDGIPSLTLDKPANVVDGDLLMAIVSLRNTEVVDTDPWGTDNYWFLGSSGIGSATIATYIYWWRASSEPADYTWTFNASTKTAGAIIAFRNIVATGDPIDDWDWVQYDGTQGTTYTLPEISTSAAPTMLVLFGSIRDDGDWTSPGDPVFRLNKGSSGGNVSVGVATELNWGAGLTGTRYLVNDAADNGVGVMLALKPTSAGGVEFVGWGIPI